MAVPRMTTEATVKGLVHLVFEHPHSVQSVRGKQGYAMHEVVKGDNNGQTLLQKEVTVTGMLGMG